jgi:hypothetical protein
MGLDMYLNGRRYISKYFDEQDGDRADAIAEQFPEINGDSHLGGSKVKEVIIEAGYWRKANAIHKWFVDHVQGGEDECKPHYVSREQLKELRELCETVLRERARAGELLPAASGFFFGSTDYDDYYYDDLETTVKIIDDCLELPESWEFEYRSSW